MSTIEVIPQTSLSKERPRARWRRNAFRATRMERLYLRYGIGVWAKLRGKSHLRMRMETTRYDLKGVLGVTTGADCGFQGSLC